MFRGTTTETLPRRSCGNWSGKTCLRWRRFAAKNWQFWCRQTHPGVNPSPRGQPAQAKTGARRHEGQSGRRLQGRPYSPPLIMTAPERILGTPGGTVIPPALAWRRAGHPEAGSRVPVVGVVPVAAAGADVPRIVVPRTAAHHTPAGGRPGFRLIPTGRNNDASALRPRHGGGRAAIHACRCCSLGNSWMPACTGMTRWH